jgi:hypothetical protein
MRKSLWLLAMFGMGILSAQTVSSLLSPAGLHALVSEGIQRANEIAFGYRSLPRSDIDISPFRRLAVGLAEVGCFEEALRVLRAMPMPERPFGRENYWQVYREVAVVAAKKGRPDIALRLVAQIPNFTMRYGKSLTPSGAMEKAQAIKSVAESLDQVSPSQARRYLRHALALAHQIAEPFWRADALSHLARVAAKIAPQDARRLAEEVIAVAKKHPNDRQRVGLLVAIAPAVRRWDADQARQLLLQALDIALRQPSDRTFERDRAIQAIVQGMREAELWDEAIKAADFLPDVMTRPTPDIPAISFIPLPTKWEALADIALALAQQKHFTRALQIAEGIRDPYQRARALISIVPLLAKNEPQKAKQWLWQATVITVRQVDPKLATSLFPDIAENFVAVAPDELGKFARQVTEALQRLDGYRAVNGLSQVATKIAPADREAASRLFEDAKNIARAIPNPDHRMVALEGLVWQMGQARFFDDALALLPEIEQASLARGRKVTEGRYLLSLSEIVVAMAQAGQTAQALSLLPKLDGNRHRGTEKLHALLAVAKGLAPSNPQKAEELLEKALAEVRWLHQRARGDYIPYDAFDGLVKLTMTVAQIVRSSEKRQ